VEVEAMAQSIEQTFAIRVPSSTKNLAMIREFIARVGEQSGLSAKALGEVELAVDEACTNVIEHAYGHDLTKEVVVRATFDEDEVRIEVIDTGRGFDPDAVEAKEVEELVEERRTGGLGLRLMKTLMDEVHYDFEPGKKNELRMVKKLAKD
jgi:serine/threonine-protein kinase RsbW